MDMRSWVLMTAAIMTAACAQPRPAVRPPEPPGRAQLAAADELVRAGCLDCLISAYRSYEPLRAIPAVESVLRFGRNRVEWTAEMRQQAAGDLLAGYLWLALACDPTYSSGVKPDERLIPLGDLAETPLLTFKDATACSRSEEKMKALLE